MLDASWPTRLRAHDAAFFFPLNADRKDARPPKRKRNKVIGTHEGHTHSPCEQQCPFDFSQAGMEMGRAGPASEGPSPPRTLCPSTCNLPWVRIFQASSRLGESHK